ncbi:flagellar hook-associated protein FlgK [Clostridium sp.]|jgi:flagellar hook-associated protein 1 FlgK|uniref:flagellar hook-associated protein FlgK n=1 Tax=Clostridium sp. TaxID=1506 RepID=UPI00258DC664|nr:flagellar hook-associated protein FlgK [Clostridium sp.]MDF2504149.1 flgK [Clostridium sp.]
MAGLFSTLNIGVSGLSAQQKAIDVTSHNIANANTEGYTRQRAIIESNRPYDMPSVNNAISAGQVGTGATVSAIQRVRDDFLDYQIRNETSTKGTNETRDSYLTQAEGILNGLSDTSLSTLTGTAFTAWQSLATQAQTSSAKTLVAQQSVALTGELNHTYNQLQSLKSDSQSYLNQQVIQVNSMLDQIDSLNQQIMRVKVSGNEPNDLMDKRDLLLDQLSSDFNINVDKENYDGVDVKPVNSGDITDATLVKSQDNKNVKRFSYVSGIEPAVDDSGAQISGEYKVTYYKNGDMTSASSKVEVYVSMTTDQAKQLDENRVLWANSDGTAINADGSVLGTSTDASGNTVVNGTTSDSPVDFSNLNLFKPDNGEIKGAMSVQADIDTYVDQLNSMAKALAFTVNSVHSGTADASSDDLPFFVNADAATYTTDSDGNSVLEGTNLSSALSRESEITAGNITVNKEILDDPTKIKASTTGDTSVDGDGDGNRALAIAQLRDKLVTIQNINSSTSRSDFITNFSEDDKDVKTVQNSANGTTLEGYFKDTVDKLAVQEQEAKRIVTNQTTLLQSFQQSRASVSGVSIDEEMANLIQYQHAYQANAKVISTVDQLLDVVINGLMK